MHHEQEVQQIAYHIWEREGHPQGRDLEHWLKAEAIWQEKQAPVAPSFQQAAIIQKTVSSPHTRETRTQTQPRRPAR